MPLNYDSTTFGRSPAAMYLTLKLNELGDASLARKVGRVLRETRELLYDVAACHVETPHLRRSSFCKLLNMIRAKAVSSCNGLPDPFIGHLVLNVIIGEVRVYERRCLEAANKQKTLNRKTPEGSTVPEAKAIPSSIEETEEERILRLRARSRRYLERKGKVNTLY